MKGCGRNTSGFVLVAALCVMVILIVLGSAAMTLSELGYISFSAERSYQLANWAAEYAIKRAVHLVDATCPSSEGSGAAGSAAFRYQYRQIGSDLCFVKAVGMHGGAQVVKTGVVPFGSARQAYGALTLRSGGTVEVSGTGKSINPDSSCAAPGILSGGILSYSGPPPINAAACSADSRGVCGSPDGIQNGEGLRCTPAPSPDNGTCTGDALSDRTGYIFNDAADWKSLKTALSRFPVGTDLALDVENLRINGLPQIPSPACICTDTGDFTLSPSASSCTGVPSFSACNKQIFFSNSPGTLTVHGMPWSLDIVVSTKQIRFSDISLGDGNFTGKKFFTTGTAGITVTAERLGTVESPSDWTVFSAGGSLTVSSMGKVTKGLFISRGGDVTLRGGSFSRSLIVTDNGVGSAIVEGGSIGDSSLVTARNADFRTGGNVTDSRIFAGSAIIREGSGAITGSLVYAAGDTVTLGTGSGVPQIGTLPRPALLITGGDLLFQHADAVSIHGIIFAEGSLMHQGGGSVSVQGAVVVNGVSGGSRVKLSGSSAFTLNTSVITNLSSSETLQGLVKPPSCGNAATARFKSDYFRSSRITAY